MPTDRERVREAVADIFDKVGGRWTDNLCVALGVTPERTTRQLVDALLSLAPAAPEPQEGDRFTMRVQDILHDKLHNEFGQERSGTFIESFATELTKAILPATS